MARVDSKVSAAKMTTLLEQFRQERQDAPDRLIPLVFDHFRRSARGQVQRERDNHTL